MAPPPSHQTKAACDSIIFVDVDGVLNVGIHDEGKAPLLLRDEDVQTAIKLAKRGYKGPEATCVEKLSALATHQVGFNENDTYEKLMTRGGAEVADVLVQRLAKIIEAAGERCKVVLSSSWRRPHHRNRRRLLESKISTFLGKEFHFHAATSVYKEEKTAADRLEVVGDYLADYCRAEDLKALRVLMLEDFFITPMDGFKVRGDAMNSVASAERMLERRAPKTDVAVKICHCYDEVTTSKGLKMQVGTGFTQRLYDEAKAFMNAETEGKTILPAIVKVLPEKVEEPSLVQMISAFVPPVSSMVRAF